MILPTVYIVDDEPELPESIADALDSLPCVVRTFSDPLRALSQLKQERVDLLITDLSLPWVDGQDLMTAARARQPNIHVLLISGYARGSQVAAEEHVRFLSKPLEPNELRDVVARELSSSLTRPTRGSRTSG
jgi:two-component system, response regulator YesN